MNTRFHLANRKEWKQLEYGAFSALFAGREATVRELLSRLEGVEELQSENLRGLFAGLPGHFAVVVEGPGYTVAAVDAARGYQLFYGQKGGVVHFSGCARAVRDAIAATEVDRTSLLEFFMSGYVTGDNTVMQEVKQVQAGEALLLTDGAAHIQSERYYLFHSKDFLPSNEDALIDRLGSVTDSIFDRLVEDLAGRPVWVPLSAGLDSRLVLAKLVERGYPHIETFSYGAPGNHEAKFAGKVAEALNVPWRFLPTTGQDMRRFHESSVRQEYWRYCDGLSTVPNPQDIVPLLALREQGVLPDDAVLVNGQSGDFSCGAHIPKALTKDGASLEMLLDLVFPKHFALWRDMLTPENIRVLRERMQGLLDGIDPDPQTPTDLAVLHDCWEWQERQCKYVVNGQRIYDFLGLDWRLPLWEVEWNEFWPQVPVEHRLGRGLHKKYLARWDYKGLFSKPSPVVRHWPGASMALFVLAQVVGLAGRDVKDAYYRYVRWCGHYGFQWHSYPFAHFIKNTQQARNLLAFYTETWAEDNLGIKGRFSA